MSDEIKKIPLWVMLAFSNIHTRKGGLNLIAFCAVFTVYCVPWSLFTESELIATLFFTEDWSWFIMMIAMCAYYFACMLWMDENKAWDLLAETETD